MSFVVCIKGIKGFAYIGKRERERGGIGIGGVSKWDSDIESDKLAMFRSEREPKPQKQISYFQVVLQVSMWHMQMLQIDSPTAKPNDPTCTCTPQPFS